VTDDPLLARVRAADPARAAHLVPRPEHVRAARRRRAVARGRRVMTAAAGALALALTAIALAPGRSDLLVEAVRASELPPRSIVVIDSVVTLSSGATVSKHQTTWMRTSRTGAVLAWRQLVTHASDPSFDTEEAGGRTAGGVRFVRSRDTGTGAVSTRRNVAGTPSTVFALEVRRRLEQARASGARVLRAARYEAVVSTARIAPALTETVELRLDPSSHAAIGYVRTDRGPAGIQRVEEQVVARTTLPDTAANRRLLELR
jgi:hypothetical protein